PVQPKKPGPRRRWLLVAGLAALPVLALVAIHFYIDHLAELNLQEALAEADRLDPGWRLDDLEASRDAYPDEENSALRVQPVLRLIPGSWASKEEFYHLFADLPKQHQLDAAAVAALREEMAKVTAAVGEARKLADMPHGRFPNPNPSDWLSPPFAGDVQG